MGQFQRFEICEGEGSDWFAVLALTSTVDCAIERTACGRYTPVVYSAADSHDVDTRVRVAMSEPCKTPEHAADVCIELAQSYYRLLAQAAGGPLPGLAYEALP
jgi:hypothetical protein